MDAWELRVVAGRAVLVDETEPDAGIDPRSLPIDEELAGSLDEWASVADALQLANPTSARLITSRGRQLAGRIAARTGTIVSFTDPLNGERAVLDGRARSGAEPTPWGTGLALTGFTVFVVVFGMIALALALGSVSGWLAFAGNIVVTLGLAPTIVVIRPLLVWRWVAYGAMIGITLGWIVWLITLF
ncbi:DUF2537 domain-containing protein [Sciscionella sediminilitoris]|uniref:DUF2537 domain-containing protein n=1 Tax=Sciscionella sediminilitoris TaxID=1445613 RepID=UPI0004DED6C8|nr:DUF2537 domain-containing protein [Sciscionella sp. SE31]